MRTEERLDTIRTLVQHLQRLRREIPSTVSGMACLRQSISELEREIQLIAHRYAAA